MIQEFFLKKLKSSMNFFLNFVLSLFIIVFFSSTTKVLFPQTTFETPFRSMSNTISHNSNASHFHSNFKFKIFFILLSLMLTLISILLFVLCLYKFKKSRSSESKLFTC